MAENVLFVRKRKQKYSDLTSDDDVWDDTLLIQAYDRAVSLAKEEVLRRMDRECTTGASDESLQVSQEIKHKKKKKHQKVKWQIGSPCQAVFSGDGKWYEATIKTMLPDKERCIVKYIGYNNEEEVFLKDLRPSAGPEKIRKQKQQANEEDVEDHTDADIPNDTFERAFSSQMHKKYRSNACNDFNQQPPFSQTSYNAHSMHIPFVPPPPPLLANRIDNSEDAEALSAMLLSWYISGFHTGYYQGIKDGKAKSFKHNQ